MLQLFKICFAFGRDFIVFSVQKKIWIFCFVCHTWLSFFVQFEEGSTLLLALDSKSKNIRLAKHETKATKSDKNHSIFMSLFCSMEFEGSSQV